MPWRELPHTADLLLEITAASWPALITEAMHAFRKQLGDADRRRPAETRAVELVGLDREELLVRWLSSHLVWAELDGVLAMGVELSVASETKLTAMVTLHPAASLTGAVKAVTYHDLRVVESSAGWRVRILFDL
ncbi:MAG: archease [Candidatus Lernaella stagnicola]|nr:archease [Candidatus Lernaella stagnicola]